MVWVAERWMSVATLGEWWGLSLPHTLLLLALMLMLVDFFIQSDVLTHVSYVLLAVVIAAYFPVHIMLRILVGFGAWILLVYLHYTLWRDFVTQIANRVIAPTRFQAGARGLIGKVGCIRQIEGQQLVSVEGDLWSFRAEVNLSVGTQVRVVGERGGILDVMPQEEMN